MADAPFYNYLNPQGGISRQLGEGIAARIFVGDQAMISVAELAPNAKGTLHSHPQEQWGVLLKGSGVRIQAGREHPVKEGDFWCTPGGVEHGLIAGPEGCRVMDIFSPPRDEYRKAGSGFGV